MSTHPDATSSVKTSTTAKAMTATVAGGTPSGSIRSRV